MTGAYIIVCVAGAVGTLLLTPVIRRIATRSGVIDSPAAAPERKIHQRPVPLLGGVAVILSFFLVLGGVAVFRHDWLAGSPGIALWGLALAGAWLVVGGVWDDRVRLSPGKQFFWPVLASLTIILAGVGIPFITNPFGGLLRLDQFTLAFGAVGDHALEITLWADVFAVTWLLGATYTTKFLDGLDGLVSGVTIIGSVLLFAVSLRPEVQQPTTALLAALLAGVFLGFLPWNFHPAKIFLGEAGSLWAGFMLGVLAIISGGKIATALLILGVPILDVLWVIISRLHQRRSPFHSADRTHLHHRLLDVGFSHRGAVLFLYALTAIFGLLTLLVHGPAKVIALLLLGAVTVVMTAVLWRRVEKKA